MKTLNKTLQLLLIDAVKTCGNFKPDDVLCQFEESLTQNEYGTLRGFLSWMTVNNKKFGHGNINQVFAEYKQAKAI